MVSASSYAVSGALLFLAISFSAAVAACYVDEHVRSLTPLFVFLGYMCSVPLILLLLPPPRRAHGEVGAWLYVLCAAAIGAVVNTGAIFLVLMNHSFPAYRASPTYSQKVLQLTVASAVTFTVADALIIVISFNAVRAYDGYEEIDEGLIDEGQQRPLLEGRRSLGMSPTYDTCTTTAVHIDENATCSVVVPPVEHWDCVEEPRLKVRDVSQPADSRESPLDSMARALCVHQATPEDLVPALEVEKLEDEAEEERSQKEEPPCPAVEQDDPQNDCVCDDKAVAEPPEAAVDCPEELPQEKPLPVKPRHVTQGRPFIGFSLSDNVKDDALIVDGIYESGPAGKAGICIDDQLVAINGESLSSMEEMYDLINKHCIPSKMTTFTMKDHTTRKFKAKITILTTDEEFRGSRFFFDRSKHLIDQSPRLKRTWKPISSPRKSLIPSEDRSEGDRFTQVNDDEK